MSSYICTIRIHVSSIWFQIRDSLDLIANEIKTTLMRNTYWTIVLNIDEFSEKKIPSFINVSTCSNREITRAIFTVCNEY